MLTNPVIISVIKYSSPLLINSNRNITAKLQTLIMKSARPILGFRSYKYSTNKIMCELKWMTIYQIIMMERIDLIHKAIFENQPKSIYNLFTFWFIKMKIFIPYKNLQFCIVWFNLLL